ncbi:glycosyltransferase family 2 protein [Peribacillus sp. B-H-3]|uniref:glycosyltransferase family 2 protein n=1 Tax=Peribacillus sp. B-H-3 TaxID=3400420 RepID=UPI003B01A03F
MRTAGSIVTYNPEILRLKENIDALISQVNLLVIIDNNSENIEAIEKSLHQYSYNKVILIKYKCNKGLAYALNNALKVALENKCQWLLTMDQDSVISRNYVDECKNIIVNNSDKNIGIISPVVIDRNINNVSPQTYIANEEKCTNLVTCITSGAFTNVNASIDCGGFDNDLFIDQIDYDLCLKLRASGYFTFRLNSSNIIHELGRIAESKIMGFKYLTTNHSSKRLYYIYRNYLIIRKRYLTLIKSDKEVKIWFKQQGLRLLYRPFKIILSEKMKTEKILSIVNGVRDGITR